MTAGLAFWGRTPRFLLQFLLNWFRALQGFGSVIVLLAPPRPARFDNGQVTGKNQALYDIVHFGSKYEEAGTKRRLCWNAKSTLIDELA
ncbi:hypothetical protein LX36DRAFT_659633 [Colletotrichum falcatum]|nr:hypothetical protein LX36DRAFT_659633 [Colletotrichum falcatum]